MRSSWNALRREIAVLRNRLSVMEAASSELEQRLFEHGVDPGAISNYVPGNEWRTRVGIPTVPTTAQELDEVAQRLLQDHSLAEAAVKFIERAYRLSFVDLPARPRGLLRTFPPSLRCKYHPNDAVAAEALRQQLIRVTPRVPTILVYRGGHVHQRSS